MLFGQYSGITLKWAYLILKFPLFSDYDSYEKMHKYMCMYVEAIS